MYEGNIDVNNSEMVKLTRNYSRREGSEMFSLTMDRYVESYSTVMRKRLENYILAYDVEIQVIEEMILYNFVTREFLLDRQKSLAKNMIALAKMVMKEFDDDSKRVEARVLNILTINEVISRVGKFMDDEFEDNFSKKSLEFLNKIGKNTESEDKSGVKDENISEEEREEVEGNNEFVNQLLKAKEEQDKEEFEKEVEEYKKIIEELPKDVSLEEFVTLALEKGVPGWYLENLDVGVEKVENKVNEEKKEVKEDVKDNESREEEKVKEKESNKSKERNGEVELNVEDVELDDDFLK